MIQDISRGEIKIPAFQRGFVWDQQKILDLLDSIYNDYPIGSILLWNSLERLKSVRNIAGFRLPDTPPNYPVNYVLDGQQRLSAIFGVFTQDRELDPASEASSFEPKMFDVYFDLRSEKFVPATQVADEFDGLPIFMEMEQTKSKSRYLRLSTLFRPTELLRQYNRIDPDLQDLAARLHSKFSNYEIPVVTIADRSKEEVGTIFERINNTGEPLTTLDLMIAWTWSEEFHLGDLIKDINSTLEHENFGKIDDKRMLQCIGALVGGSARTEDIQKLNAKSVRAVIPKLEESLRRSIDFLRNTYNVYSERMLPQSHQLVPLVYFFAQVKYPDQSQARHINRWFWGSSFATRYSGATDTRLNEDIAYFKAVAKGEYGGLRDHLQGIGLFTFRNYRYSLNSPITRAYLLLLAQRSPRDLLYGNPVPIDKALASLNQKELHHVFPRDYLIGKGMGRDADNLCNICLLPAHVNKEISNRPPSDYLFGNSPTERLLVVASRKVTDPKIRAEVLASNLLPEDSELYLEDKYEEFLARRNELSLSYLNELT